MQNFENQNPANTLWSKQYNLWSKIDTEPERYLDFEKWWGGHVTLNAEEIQWIVDELFVGNHLAAGDIRTPDGTAIDLRTIRSPIVVFCSKGDNITPPQQALDWILDLYDSVDDIRAWGQTIVYTVHDKVGHLGIFVSGRRRAEGARRVRLEHRPDRRAAARPLRGGADAEGRGGRQPRPRHRRVGDALRGAHPRRHPRPRRQRPRRRAQVRGRRAGSRRSTSRSTAPSPSLRCAPWSRRRSPRRCAGCTRCGSPTRCSARATRGWPGSRPRPSGSAAAGSPARPAIRSWPRRRSVSRQIVEGLEAWRQAVERLSEETFHAIYGTPALQAALGIDTASTEPPAQGGAKQAARRTGRAPHRGAAGRHEPRRPREALVRALLWVGMARNAVDERGFAAITRLRDAHPANQQMSLADFKALVREQYLMLAGRRGGGAPRDPRPDARARSRSGARPSPRCAACSRQAVPSTTRRPSACAVSPRSSACGPELVTQSQGVLRTEATVAADRRRQIRAPDRRRPGWHPGGYDRRPSLRRDLAARRGGGRRGGLDRAGACRT